MSDLELFSTSQCPKCVKLSEFLSSKSVEFSKRVIDTDPEAETDALMLNIFSAPALKKQEKVLRTKDIFTKDQLNEEKIKDFLGI